MPHPLPVGCVLYAVLGTQLALLEDRLYEEQPEHSGREEQRR